MLTVSSAAPPHHRHPASLHCLLSQLAPPPHPLCGYSFYRIADWNFLSGPLLTLINLDGLVHEVESPKVSDADRGVHHVWTNWLHLRSSFRRLRRSLSFGCSCLSCGAGHDPSLTPKCPESRISYPCRFRIAAAFQQYLHSVKGGFAHYSRSLWLNHPSFPQDSGEPC